MADPKFELPRTKGRLRIIGRSTEKAIAQTLTSAYTIRIEPPLVIAYEQLDEVLNLLEETLAEVNQSI